MKPIDRLCLPSWKTASRDSSGMPSNMARIFKLTFKNKLQLFKSFKIFSQIKTANKYFVSIKAAYFLEIKNS
jgi:hypothetical protein